MCSLSFALRSFEQPKMLWLTVFCSLLFAVPAKGDDVGMLQPIRNEHNTSAIACIVELCERYYDTEKKKIGALLVVHIQNATPFHDQLMKTLMERNSYAIDLINQYTHCKEECYFNFVEKAKNYFVAFREFDEVTAALRLWHGLPTWNALAQFVAVFINNFDDKTLLAHIRHIMETFFEYRVLNIKVISFRRHSSVIQVHTWYPYEGTNCADEVRNIHLIDECHYSDARNGPQAVRNVAPIQPIIPLNLHGCPLRVATSVYEPYVFYDSGRKDFYRGIEVRLVRTIAQALEMTPIFIHMNETRVNRIVSNKTGIYSMLLTRYDLTYFAIVGIVSLLHPS